MLCNAQISNIILEGNYQGKNLYIQNPAVGNDYCTEKVLVNGKKISFTNTDAYEIKLDSLGFKLGDSVKVEIFHKDDCKPKVLNYNGNPNVTFEITSISVDSNAVLHWVSKNEIGKLPFIIEQFRWNKWVKVGEVEEKGGLEENEYYFQTIPHSGKNQFRVKQNSMGTGELSKSAYFTSNLKAPKIKSPSLGPSKILEFDKETMYEIYDQEGNLLKKGTAKSVNCKDLVSGAYYLNYDNIFGEFVIH